MFRLVKKIESTEKMWSTKPHSVWLSIMLALQISKPVSVVELGAGKSTRYLGEYCKEEHSTLKSFEQNEGWVRRVTEELTQSQLPQTKVVYAPIVNGWYAMEIIKKEIPSYVDAWLIDGPIGNDRRSVAGKEFLFSSTASARLLMVDDLHRGHIFDFFEQLVSTRSGMDYIVVSYSAKPDPSQPNLLGIAMSASSIALLEKTLSSLKVPFQKAQARKLISEP